MKVSVKLEYACRVMVQLARMQPGGELAHIGALAESEGVAPNYLVQILTDLREAGLIQSRRGKQGGYCLAAPAERISLLQIVRAVEGGLMELGETQPGESAVVVRGALEELRAALDAHAGRITLDKLVLKAPEAMYFI